MGKIIKYNMELEVLTPLHIASGEELNKMEYLFNQGKRELTIIDNAKFVDYLIKKNLFDKYLNYIENYKHIELFAFIKNHKILDEDIKTFSKKVYKNLNLVNDDIKNGIKKLNRNIQGKPYIQGSSIKGALLNTLLVDYIINHRDEFNYEKNEIFKLLKNTKELKYVKKDLKRITDNLVKKILNLGMKNDKVKVFGISVSDSYKYENTRTNFYKDIDRHLEDRNQKETSMPITREYIEAKSRFYFDITVDFDMLSKTKLDIKNMDELIEHLENANDYLINHTLNINDPAQYTLILGANTGFHQKTIIHALFENKHERTEVTKKILHKETKNRKTKKMFSHLDDKISPRVLNGMNENNDFEIAGLVKLKEIGEKNVGRN